MNAQVKIKEDTVNLGGFCAYHKSVSRPVTIRGIQYPSMSAAARYLGVSASAVQHALRTENLDNVGVHSTRKVFAKEYDKLLVASVNVLSGDPDRMRHGLNAMKEVHDALGVQYG